MSVLINYNQQNVWNIYDTKGHVSASVSPYLAYLVDRMNSKRNEHAKQRWTIIEATSDRIFIENQYYIHLINLNIY
jgi:hypothetical protein